MSMGIFKSKEEREEELRLQARMENKKILSNKPSLEGEKYIQDLNHEWYAEGLDPNDHLKVLIEQNHTIISLLTQMIVNQDGAVGLAFAEALKASQASKYSYHKQEYKNSRVKDAQERSE